MNSTCPLVPRPLVRLAPITANIVQRNPKILLGGSHQPTLLRYLDGWPRRKGRASAFLIQFVEAGASLASFSRDTFDLAVIQAPSAAQAEDVIAQLIRVARRGLITRR
ncbi:class I SAM-dependent methyltransferase [Pseudomonas putida]|nr:class I SAM-dependent methyltransferase [Pseudomonas putida]